MEPIISPHAKERAHERYGVLFSGKQWTAFGRTLRNEKFAIRLRNGRCACFFTGQWFLLVQKGNTVLTFLSPDDATDGDKTVLRNDERYRRINKDTFRIWTTPSRSVDEPGVVRTTEIPLDAEIPDDIQDAAQKQLKKICDK